MNHELSFTPIGRRILHRLRHRLRLGAAVGCAVAACAVFSGMAPGSKISAALPSVFQPLTLFPLVDSALIVGTLPNGMRYYIKRNMVPAKRAYLWLAVNAGSLYEDEDQRGYAHFLEHMAFNGTKHFPGNTLIDVVENAGMDFGADLNAYTNYDETVYQLTIPTDDAKTFQQGLTILTDWAGGQITIDSAQVIAERGVVLGEWRARHPDTISQRIFTQGMARVVGQDSKYLIRSPIGSDTSIERALPAPIARFYRDWYRPDMMAVIAVGDFDPKAVYKEIVTRFGSIPKPSSPRSFTRPTVAPVDTTVVYVVKDKVNPSVSLEWPIPVTEATPDAEMRRALLEEIFFPTLQQTLTSLSKRERRPFLTAVTGRAAGFPRPVADHYLLRVIAHPDSLLFGLRSTLVEVERIAQHGIAPAELELAKAAVLRRYEGAADGAAGVGSRQLAQAYVRHFLAGNVPLWSPAQALTLARKILPTITSDDVATFARLWRTTARRAVWFEQTEIGGVRPITPAGVLAMFDTLVSTPVSVAMSKTVSQANLDGSLVTTPPPVGTIVSEATLPSVGVTTWQLSNGARVVFKETHANPDGITIRAWSPGGHSLLPDSLFYSSSRLVGMLMTSAGGISGHAHDQFEQELSRTGLKQLRVDLNAFEESMTIGGSSRELAMLFQLLYLQFTNPSIDTVALEEWRRTGGLTLQMSKNDQLALGMARGPYSRRLSQPQPASVPFIDLDQAMAVYHNRFGDASDFTFFVVGATTAAELKPLIAQYVASLPSTHRRTRETPRNFELPVPTQRSVREQRGYGTIGRATNELRWNGVFKGTSASYVAERQKLLAISLILGRRLRNRLREQMGVTYSVSAPVRIYRTPDARYVISSQLMTAPDKMPAARQAMWDEIDALRRDGPTAEELAIATTILQRYAENAQQSNGWWIEELSTLEALGVPFDSLGRAPLTAQAVREAANQYLSKEIYTQRAVEVLEKVKSPTAGKKPPPDDTITQAVFPIPTQTTARYRTHAITHVRSHTITHED